MSADRPPATFLRCAALGLGAALLAADAARPIVAGDPIYYRRDENGAIVLTNVPDHRDLRALPRRGPIRGGSGEQYRDLIRHTALHYGVSPDLVYAMAAVESNFDPVAVSAKGAQGLMQLMPDTAARFGVVDPFNPAENILGGVRYLRHLLDLFEGDHRLAIAAYNAGETVVRTLNAVPPYPETLGYVRKVLRLFGNGRPYAGAAPPAAPAPAPPAPPVPAAVR